MKNTDFIRRWRNEGWTVEKTKGGHLRLTHPMTTEILFTASTPSDWRGIRNNEARMRRALRNSPSGIGLTRDVVQPPCASPFPEVRQVMLENPEPPRQPVLSTPIASVPEPTVVAETPSEAPVTVQTPVQEPTTPEIAVTPPEPICEPVTAPEPSTQVPEVPEERPRKSRSGDPPFDAIIFGKTVAYWNNHLEEYYDLVIAEEGKRKRRRKSR